MHPIVKDLSYSWKASLHAKAIDLRREHAVNHKMIQSPKQILFEQSRGIVCMG
jgi:hypothetical protein